ncbi:tetrahydrofolate synthase [Weissella oryzae SG25]|uniref:tetrahydrofolate synthase n=1 Tax=Weissella oryzae (strain DSM 25784 / JCM 18191 / LMG 30913 / SG25) TaxID=1329250 RepID=A0A069CSQ1_WEIOS|nr:Mur ligase family protein [Weissella oryzae]GAK30509.1 tetrahydrofolate synthase [Weissella oryzae SG25]
MGKVETLQQITARLDENWWPANTAGSRIAMLQEILHWLGDPDLQSKIIHITGTNGKGSTGVMTADILIAAGYKVGHFSTPAIMDDREMVSVNHQMIAKDTFMRIYGHIKQVIEEHGGHQDTLSGQEWWTLVALYYFAEVGTDFVILEAGWGGINDATNMVTNPVIIAITKINEDDLEEKEDSIAAIANEKAELIKPGAMVVNYPGQAIEVYKVLEAKVAEVGAYWNTLPRPKITLLSGSPNGLNVNIDNLENVHLGLTGAYQVHNLSTVMQIIDVLKSMDCQISDDAIKQGLADVKIPGRMEYDKERNILYDGAHNPEGIRALVASMRAWHLAFKPTVILGLLENSNTQEILDELLPNVETIIAVTPEAPSYKHVISADALAARIVMMSNVDVEIADDPSAAIQLARRVRESSQAMIIVTGSFYTLRAIQSDERI